jgi:hypothetical protein
MSQDILGTLKHLVADVDLARYVQVSLTPFRTVEESTRETFDRVLSELVETHPKYKGWIIRGR